MDSILSYNNNQTLTMEPATMHKTGRNRKAKRVGSKRRYNMKKIASSVLIGLGLTSILAFSAAKFQPSHATAEVVMEEGFYLFTDSKPVMPYDSLGTVDLGFVTGTQYENIRSNLMKRARKKYPKADGLIFNLKKNGIDHANVIKFK